MKEKYKKLFTYCGLNNKKENIIAEIESKEIEEWKNSYLNSFKESYVSSKDELGVQKYYCDPDQTYEKGYKHQFFEHLEIFLNKREEEFKNKFKDEWGDKFKYEFEEGKGIKVIINTNDFFYLKSDQLGFSAPSKEKKHPYDLYLEKKGNSDATIQKVTEWIISSRTIGGSFLWPMPFYKQYNFRRGGAITSNRSKYIQDRVDLTLWEIYYLYQIIDQIIEQIENVGKNTIMKSCMVTCNNEDTSNKDQSNLTKWLKHFKNFKTYVQFFCFCDFVRKEEDEYKPVDLFTGQINEPQWGEQGEHPEVQIKDDVDPDELVEMLEQLNDKILSRSQKIEKLIKKEDERVENDD